MPLIGNKMIRKILFILLATISLFLSPALALLGGILFALILSPQFEKQTRLVSKYLLQGSVVGLGFGMNIVESLQASSEGMVFTIGSVVLVMYFGVLLGRLMGVDKKVSYLIATGTAICGGSAIAAVSPVIKADSNQISVSLAVIFTLNAVAMFIFPTIGEWFGLTQQQFGTWAAIAIHDTSSVIGAGQAYGEQALTVATTVKLTRALWIIPLLLFSIFVFKSKENNKNNKTKISIPWFILVFILAMIINTYVPLNDTLSIIIKEFSHRALSLTLFLIGSTLSISAIRSVGVKPIILGVVLWIVISVTSLTILKLFF